MKRTAFYSTARSAAAPAALPAGAAPAAAGPTRRIRPDRRWRRVLPLLLLLMLSALGGGLLSRQFMPPAERLTQADIDRAVLRSFETKTLPSATARAYARVSPSVVRVSGREPADPASAAQSRGKGRRQADAGGSERTAIGSGVVITEQGAILTSLHVVLGTREIRVRFADGSESGAAIASVDPANDLAVLRAERVPDDLRPATLVSTAGLQPGDEVAAVGFPFGFGPSVSAGVVSGLGREFRSPEGDTLLGGLIQFDAAANPGNSGGPLVNMKGEVVGIVAALLNPVQQRFFVGLGFAVPIENAAAGVGLSPF